MPFTYTPEQMIEALRTRGGTDQLLPLLPDNLHLPLFARGKDGINKRTLPRSIVAAHPQWPVLLEEREARSGNSSPRSNNA